MNVLVATHFFQGYTGSEIIALEVAESLRNHGHSVVIAANHVGATLRQEAERQGIAVTGPGQFPRAREFDLLWLQHHLFPLLPGFPDEVGGGLRVFCHFSPFQPLEVPAPLVEEEFADLILVNSPETLARMTELGLPADRLRLFPNPAPRTFQGPPQSAAGLRRLLVISNHLPREVAAAGAVLARRHGVQTWHIGLEGEYRRVTPADLRSADAVLTIGKSVQYALLARRPVFCYDHYGGPGWLTKANLAAAQAANFSGRCTPRRRNTEELAAEALNGFRQAQAFAASFDRGHDFLLDRFLAEFVQRATAGSRATQPRSASDPQLQRMAALSQVLALANFSASADAPKKQPASDAAARCRLEGQWAEHLLCAGAASPTATAGQRLAEAVRTAAARSGMAVVADLPQLMEQRAVAPHAATRVAGESGGLILSCPDNDPGLWLTWTPADAARPYLLVVGLTADLAGSNDSQAQLFWRDDPAAEYSQEQSTLKRVFAGDNVFVFAVAGGWLASGVRLDPAMCAGTFRLWCLSIAG